MIYEREEFTMKLRAISFAIGALMLSSGAAYADNITVQTMQTTFDPTIPAITQPLSMSESSYESKRKYKNRSEMNLSNDFGNGSQNSSTIGVDYGIGANITGPVGNPGLAISPPYSGRLRERTVGSPHKRRVMIYDNNVSVALPSIR